jgi:hypothetical protein
MSIYYVSQLIGRGTAAMYFMTKEGPFSNLKEATFCVLTLREIQPQFEFVVEEENERGESKVLEGV